jgi:hypothetical protein
VPLAIEELLELTVIDWSVAGVIVRAKLLEAMLFCVAMTLLEPTPTPVARPVALMLTDAGFELVQTDVLVRFCVLPSLKLPVAVN